MRGKIEATEEGMKNLAISMAKAYGDCFTKESTEHWIRRFAKSHYDTIYQVQVEDFDNKIPNKLYKVFESIFVQLIQYYIKNKPKKAKEEVDNVKEDICKEAK